jgi:hypothetical protein
MNCGFPKIDKLPVLLFSNRRWRWRKFELRPEFWVAVDEQDRSWLVKMTGKRYSVREHIFAVLAQKVGLCAQSSTYLLLRNTDPPRHDPRQDTGKHQLAIWIVEEHAQRRCRNRCQYLSPRTVINDDWWQLWLRSGVRNPWHWFELQVLGLICGQHEPSGGIVTKGHVIVGFDNEQMFGGWPFERRKWSHNAVREINENIWVTLPKGPQRIRSLCKRVMKRSDSQLDEIVAVPKGYRAKSVAGGYRKWLAQARSTAAYLNNIL